LPPKAAWCAYPQCCCTGFREQYSLYCCNTSTPRPGESVL
jgi:hypothetical protein